MLLPDTTSTRDAAENGREARDDRNLPAMCRRGDDMDDIYDMDGYGSEHTRTDE